MGVGATEAMDPVPVSNPNPSPVPNPDPNPLLLHLQDGCLLLLVETLQGLLSI